MSGSSRTRLPWEIVETFPSTDALLVEEWRHRRRAATGVERVRASVGLALALYWAAQEEVDDREPEQVAAERGELVDEAQDRARALGDPGLLAECLLGDLYARWGPDSLLDRHPVLAELSQLRDAVRDDELRLRIDEWSMLDAFDHGDLDRVRDGIRRFHAQATDRAIFQRREELWRANLAMLTGDLDRAIAINQEAVAATSPLAGTPFAFQNVAITVAIERFLRRGLADVVGSVRSIRASSPRVGTNWDVGLAFTLSEIGALDEAAAIYQPLADDAFRAVPRDLNWLVTTQLLALIAVTLDDRRGCARLLAMLEPYIHRDGTHGCGYASYGPVARNVGMLRAALGDRNGALAAFDHVITTREPGPWTALTTLAAAQLRRATEPARAGADARAVVAAARSSGMDAVAAEAEALALAIDLDGHGEPVAAAVDRSWLLRHPSGAAEVPDSVGVRHLLVLLRTPGASIDVLDLDGRDGDGADATVAVGATLDHEARRAYRARLRDLDARSRRSASEEAEAAALRRELAAGRHVRSVSAEVERTRIRVTKALTRAMERIAEASPELAEHLRGSITTGRRCSYAPADGRAWRVVRRPP